ncbi:hypothetical protein B0H10DRAFT_1944386 [Mycena sp. CBHHK59/15]|nr:hypothetical protein B0H10DRAFT_1944386 [Mycena sp. CBHHK59/15]
MNRLRKTSQSLQNPTASATSVASSNAHAIAVQRPPSAPLSATYKAALQPRSSAEQYWAARALAAETLLAARLQHQKELRSLSYSEETKRSRELAALMRAHDARHAQLERLVLALLALLVILVLALLGLAHRATPAVPRTRGLGHFTIPILSPFTSVRAERHPQVEHETSVVGAKTLAVCALALAGLAYFVFRHWLARRRT